MGPIEIRNAAFVALAVAAPVLFSACGVTPAPTAATVVRARLTPFVVAELDDDGATMCSLMTKRGQQGVAAAERLDKVHYATCSAALTASLKNGKRAETVAQAKTSIAAAPVLIRGNTATVTLAKAGFTALLVRIHRRGLFAGS